MNKIKVIDLLNIISKGEEIPEKIKYKGYEFEYNQGEEDYFNRKMGYGMLDDLNLFSELNKEVEILNEAKEDKIQKIYHCETSLTQNEVEIFITENLNQMVDKINELIDEINNLKEK